MCSVMMCHQNAAVNTRECLRLALLQAVVLMDGKPIDNYTMSNGVLKTE